MPNAIPLTLAVLIALAIIVIGCFYTAGLSIFEPMSSAANRIQRIWEDRPNSHSNAPDNSLIVFAA